MILPALGTYSSLKFIEAAKESLLYYTFGNQVSINSDGVEEQDASLRKSHTDVWSHMIGAKRVFDDDLMPMATRYDWIEGEVYVAYDDSVDLTEKPYYVVLFDEGQYSVFLCLGNNGNAPSTQRPSQQHTYAGDTSYIIVADGYQWFHLYSISSELWNKFATDRFIPVIENEGIKAAAIDGGIYTVKVEEGGRYPAHAKGFIESPNIAGNTRLTSIESETRLSANTDFYKESSIYLTSGKGAGQLRNIEEYVVTGEQRIILIDRNWDVTPDTTTRFDIAPSLIIEGDGDNAQGRVIMNTALDANTVSRVEILNSGEGYMRADAIVRGNTGIIGGSSDAILRPIISPPGGHGSNAFSETQTTRASISVTAPSSASGILPTEVDFDQIAFILNPQLTVGSITIDKISGFTGGEILHFPNARAILDETNGAVLTLKNIDGVISEGDMVTAPLSGETATINSIDINYAVKRQALLLSVEVSFAGDDNQGFVANETISQDLTKSTGTVLNTTTTNGLMYIVNERGGFQPSDVSGDLPIVGLTSNATGRITGISRQELIQGSGEVLYAKNLETVTRSDGQSETVRVILSF